MAVRGRKVLPTLITREKKISEIGDKNGEEKLEEEKQCRDQIDT